MPKSYLALKVWIGLSVFRHHHMYQAHYVERILSKSIVLSQLRSFAVQAVMHVQ